MYFVYCTKDILWHIWYYYNIGNKNSVLVCLVTAWFISISFKPIQNQVWCSFSLYAGNRHASLTSFVTTWRDHTPWQRYQHHPQRGQHSLTTLTTFFDTLATLKSSRTHSRLPFIPWFRYTWRVHVPWSSKPSQIPRIFPHTTLYTRHAHIPWSSRLFNISPIVY